VLKTHLLGSGASVGQRRFAAAPCCVPCCRCSAAATPAGAATPPSLPPVAASLLPPCPHHATSPQHLENRPASVAPQQAHACCEGYFCPPQLTCMMPCPFGAYCPRWVSPVWVDGWPGSSACTKHSSACACQTNLPQTVLLPSHLMLAAPLAMPSFSILPAGLGLLPLPTRIVGTAMPAGAPPTLTRSALTWAVAAPTRQGGAHSLVKCCRVRCKAAQGRLLFLMPWQLAGWWDKDSSSTCRPVYGPERRQGRQT